VTLAEELSEFVMLLLRGDYWDVLAMRFMFELSWGKKKKINFKEIEKF
jgi:hypothetical protein